MSKKTRIAIVDDDAEFQATVAECLEDEPTFQLICTCSSGEEALERLPEEKQRPDIVLMDINMKGMSGIECVRKLKRLLPATHVVMLTVFEDTRSIFPALAAIVVLLAKTGYRSADKYRPVANRWSDERRNCER